MTCLGVSVDILIFYGIFLKAVNKVRSINITIQSSQSLIKVNMSKTLFLPMKIIACITLICFTLNTIAWAAPIAPRSTLSVAIGEQARFIEQEVTSRIIAPVSTSSHVAEKHFDTALIRHITKKSLVAYFADYCMAKVREGIRSAQNYRTYITRMRTKYTGIVMRAMPLLSIPVTDGHVTVSQWILWMPFAAFLSFVSATIAENGNEAVFRGSLITGSIFSIVTAIAAGLLLPTVSLKIIGVSLALVMLGYGLYIQWDMAYGDGSHIFGHLLQFCLALSLTSLLLLPDVTQNGGVPSASQTSRIIVDEKDSARTENYNDAFVIPQIDFAQYGKNVSDSTTRQDLSGIVQLNFVSFIVVGAIAVCALMIPQSIPYLLVAGVIYTAVKIIRLVGITKTMRVTMICGLFVFGSALFSTAFAQSYKFAQKYTAAQMLQEPTARRFIDEYLTYEHNYFKIARVHGIATDGWDISYETLKPLNVREHTAASKEALDIGVLVRGLAGDKNAVQLMALGDALAAKREAIQILTQKITMYEQYKKTYPGYGGFLTWVKVTANGIEPTSDWSYRVPALDNGEWVWSLYAAYKTLYALGEHTLAQRYEAYFNVLVKNAPTIFYDFGLRKVRAETKINDIRSQVVIASNYTNNIKDYYLDDVYEGLMMVHFLTLFTDLPQSEKNHIWDDIKIERIDSKWGTTYKGWPDTAPLDGSPHIKWAYMYLPFTDNPIARKVYRIQEEIRSNLHDYGLPVSTNTPGAIGYTQYNPNIFAPYGAFGMIFDFALEGNIALGNYGLAWFLQMIQADKMQGEVGSGESFSVTPGFGMPTLITYEHTDKSGTKATKTLRILPGRNVLEDVSFLVTADGKMTVWLALCGGVINEVRQGLKDDGLYQVFMDIVNNEYQIAFEGGVNDNASYRLPKASITGLWTKKTHMLTEKDIDLKTFWKYPALDKWGDKTVPVILGKSVMIDYLPVTYQGSGWAGGSFDGKIVPTEESAFFFRGTGSFMLKLEGEKDSRGNQDKVLIPVQLKGDKEWTKVSLKKVAGRPFFVMVMDQITEDVVLSDRMYSPTGTMAGVNSGTNSSQSVQPTTPIKNTGDAKTVNNTNQSGQSQNNLYEDSRQEIRGLNVTGYDGNAVAIERILRKMADAYNWRNGNYQQGDLGYVSNNIMHLKMANLSMAENFFKKETGKDLQLTNGNTTQQGSVNSAQPSQAQGDKYTQLRQEIRNLNASKYDGNAVAIEGILRKMADAYNWRNGNYQQGDLGWLSNNIMHLKLANLYLAENMLKQQTGKDLKLTSKGSGNAYGLVGPVFSMFIGYLLLQMQAITPGIFVCFVVVPFMLLLMQPFAKKIVTRFETYTAQGKLLFLLPLFSLIMASCEESFEKGFAEDSVVGQDVFTQDRVSVDAASSDEYDYATVEHRMNGVLYQITSLVLKKGTDDIVTGMSFPTAERNGERAYIYPDDSEWGIYKKAWLIQYPEEAENLHWIEKGYEERKMNDVIYDEETQEISVDSMSILSVAAADTVLHDNNALALKKRSIPDCREAFAFFEETYARVYAPLDSLQQFVLAHGQGRKVYYEHIGDSATLRPLLIEVSDTDNAKNIFVCRYDVVGRLQDIIGVFATGEQAVISMGADTSTVAAIYIREKGSAVFTEASLDRDYHFFQPRDSVQDARETVMQTVLNKVEDILGGDSNALLVLHAA